MLLWAFQTVKKIGSIAYQLALLMLAHIYDAFHVLKLKHYAVEPSQ